MKTERFLELQRADVDALLYGKEITGERFNSFGAAALISKALSIAMEAHEGQVDKGGNPYIWHPVRVALHCRSDEEKIVALLHDVVEDTSVTIDDLAQIGFSEQVLSAIQCLTKKDGEDYMDFIKRVSGNEIATNVKIQDLNDNMDLSRLNGRKPWKLDTYRKALEYLTECRAL